MLSLQIKTSIRVFTTHEALHNGSSSDVSCHRFPLLLSHSEDCCQFLGSVAEVWQSILEPDVDPYSSFNVMHPLLWSLWMSCCCWEVARYALSAKTSCDWQLTDGAARARGAPRVDLDHCQSWLLTLFKPGGAHCAPPVTYLRITVQIHAQACWKNLTFPIMSLEKGHILFTP